MLINRIRLTIVHTGTIYDKKENCDHMLRAIYELVCDGEVGLSEINVDHYGPRSKSLEKLVKKYQLEAVVLQHGIVPRNVAISVQRGAQVLWLLKWEDKKKNAQWHAENSPIPSKLYEYMAAKRPVLATGAFVDEVDRIIDETMIGDTCHSSNEVKSILKGYLNDLRLEVKV